MSVVVVYRVVSDVFQQRSFAIEAPLLSEDTGSALISEDNAILVTEHA